MSTKELKVGVTKPKGWEKLTPVGSVHGDPQVGFCPDRKLPYIVSSTKEILWQEAPEGFEFDTRGILIAKGEVA